MAFEAFTVRSFWDASANHPALITGKGRNGDAYLCVVAGDPAIGQAGAFEVGDLALFVLDRWVRIPASIAAAAGDIGLKSGKLNQFAETSSDELRGVISDAVGTGPLVFQSFVTDAINALYDELVEYIAVALTALIPTGFIIPTARLATSSGWLMCNGKTIGNAASGGTALASADAWPLFDVMYGWGNTQAPVSGGRGVSAVADFAANKTIQLVDVRGRAIFGNDHMDNANAGRLTALISGIAGTTPGAVGGDQRSQQHGHTVNDPPHHHSAPPYGFFTTNGGEFQFKAYDLATEGTPNTGDSTTGVTVNNAGAGGSENVPPAIVLNYMIRM